MARPAAAALRSSKQARFPARIAVPLLPPATGDLPEDGGVQLAPAAAPRRKNIEHCGHVYQHRLRRANGEVLVADGAKPGARDAAAAAKAPASDDDDHAGTQLKKLLTKDSDDLYDLLELGDLRWRATADDIKKSFRKFSLMYHPDKVCHLGKEALEDSETHFKKVKKAYDVLADKKKRASYDSIDDVDDSIPSEASVNDKNFYTKLKPVFELNARWSSANRVPGLGDEKTPIDDVNKFYDFWYSFKTWRDFSFDLEYDTDQAECREEKRWMDRQNQKHIKTRKLEEAARIRKLVDVAYKKDPRIRRAKDEVKERKEAAKRERLREREAVAEAEEREKALKREADEKKAADEKETRARAKKDKDAARQIMRRARQKLRNVVKQSSAIENVDVLLALERCCAELSVPVIENLAVALSSVDGEDAASVLKVLNNGLEGQSETAAESLSSAEDKTPVVAVEPPLKTSSKSRKEHDPEETKSGSEWQPEEMKRLTKALSKFPPGTRDRYEKLATFVGTRDAASCLAVVNASRPKNVSGSGASSGIRRPIVAAAASDFERFQRDKKKCDVTEKKPPSATYDSTAAPISKDFAGSNGSMNGKSVTPQKESLQDEPEKNVVPDKRPNSMRFTPKQQSQLEVAMKKYPTSFGTGRWFKIAADVSDRTADECQKRYTELVSYYKARSQQKPGRK